MRYPPGSEPKDHPPQPARPPGQQWWTINGQTLLDALTDCHRGADPDIIYLELWANSEHEDHDD